MRSYTFIVLIVSFFVISNTPDKRRQIITDDYNFDFFITYDVIKNYDQDKKYYWFKNGGLHSSFGGANGYLLNGEFKKEYVPSNLAERGVYKKGLKHGVWTTWHANGTIDVIQHWNKGLLSGDHKSYSESGKLISSGKYSNNKKQGIWINHIKKDTIRYKKDSLFISKPKRIKDEEKPGFTTRVKTFFKSIFSKKENREATKKSKSKTNNSKRLNKKKSNK